MYMDLSLVEVFELKFKVCVVMMDIFMCLVYDIKDSK